MERRAFLQALSVAAGMAAGRGGLLHAAADDSLYNIPNHGQVRILHTCDTHAQLLPLYYREPHINLGFGAYKNTPPHIVGRALLAHHKIPAGTPLAHALTHLDFTELAARYGRMGGYAHLATLCERLRGSYGAHNTLHLDSGDLWHGSATALYTRGEDMVAAANLLGVDAMVGHWEFTYPAAQLHANIAAMNGAFLAQNVFVKDEALFDGSPAYDEDSGLAFPPYMVKEVGGKRIAVIGQAFPYTPIANPQRFIPDWTFGVQAEHLQAVVDTLRQDEQADAVILLSHNGSDLDVAVAADVRGIDFILGGHTHDIFYQARQVGQTVVVNSGCVGKFLGCLDIAFAGNKIDSYRWHALPVFANLLPPQPAMQQHIRAVRAPYAAELEQVVGQTDDLLYRRGNFNGTLDNLIIAALRAHYGAQIALTPGFRWGASILPGAIRHEDIMNATAITYPETYVRDMRGAEIKTLLEAVADNLYNPNPYYQQGGDMVRAGGLAYTLHPAGASGQRISNLRLADGNADGDGGDGAPIDADKFYKVAGWATPTPSPGPPVWEVVLQYLGKQTPIPPLTATTPALIGVDGNAGIAPTSYFANPR